MKALEEELFSGVKDKQEFNTILSDLFKHGIEMVHKAELDEHLGHELKKTLTTIITKSWNQTWHRLKLLSSELKKKRSN